MCRSTSGIGIWCTEQRLPWSTFDLMTSSGNDLSSDSRNHSADFLATEAHSKPFFLLQFLLCCNYWTRPIKNGRTVSQIYFYW